MKRFLSIAAMAVIVAVFMTGCTPSISEDTYEILDIFKESKDYTFERTEDETNIDVVYSMTVVDDFVSTETTIDFEAGQFRSESQFNSKTLLPYGAAKGNSYALDPDQNWDIKAIYADVLSMTAKTPEGTETRTLDLPERYIDNEALLFSLGALDYEEGYEKNINVAIIDAGDMITFRVSQMGIETITVPYGTVECIKVEVKYTGIVLGAKPKMYIWYSNDEQRLPVMYENRGIFLKLKDITAITAE